MDGCMHAWMDGRIAEGFVVFCSLSHFSRSVSDSYNKAVRSAQFVVCVNVHVQSYI